MRIDSNKISRIEDYGSLPMTFQSSGDEVYLLLRDVAHVPSLSYCTILISESRSR